MNELVDAAKEILELSEKVPLEEFEFNETPRGAARIWLRAPGGGRSGGIHPDIQARDPKYSHRLWGVDLQFVAAACNNAPAIARRMLELEHENPVNDVLEENMKLRAENERLDLELRHTALELETYARLAPKYGIDWIVGNCKSIAETIRAALKGEGDE